MDLNPREAVVDQESSYTSEQEEESTHALIVPENFVGAAMDGLALALAPGRGVPKAVAVMRGTACRYTGKRPNRDHHCGDVA
jgi:hypothetical protein